MSLVKVCCAYHKAASMLLVRWKPAPKQRTITQQPPLTCCLAALFPCWPDTPPLDPSLTCLPPLTRRSASCCWLASVWPLLQFQAPSLRPGSVRHAVASPPGAPAATAGSPSFPCLTHQPPLLPAAPAKQATAWPIPVPVQGWLPSPTAARLCLVLTQSLAAQMTPLRSAHSFGLTEPALGKGCHGARRLPAVQRAPSGPAAPALVKTKHASASPTLIVVVRRHCA